VEPSEQGLRKETFISTDFGSTRKTASLLKDKIKHVELSERSILHKYSYRHSRSCKDVEGDLDIRACILHIIEFTPRLYI